MFAGINYRPMVCGELHKVDGALVPLPSGAQGWLSMGGKWFPIAVMGEPVPAVVRDPYVAETA